jgi:sulfite oxidase
MLSQLARSGSVPQIAVLAAAQHALSHIRSPPGSALQHGRTLHQAPAAAAGAAGRGTTSSRTWTLWASLLSAGALGASFLYTPAAADARQASLKQAKRAAAAEEASKPKDAVAPTSSQEKVFTAEEVAKHKTPDTRVWVTYKDGVYDITDFVQNHPGGAQKIMLAGVQGVAARAWVGWDACSSSSSSRGLYMYIYAAYV